MYADVLSECVTMDSEPYDVDVRVTKSMTREARGSAGFAFAVAGENLTL